MVVDDERVGAGDMTRMYGENRNVCSLLKLIPNPLKVPGISKKIY